MDAYPSDHCDGRGHALMFVVTDLARTMLAEAAKGRHPETGRFTADPKHPYIAEGHAADSPGNLPATARPAPLWHGTEAHLANVQGNRLVQVGDVPAAEPDPLMAVQDSFGADTLGRFTHQGSVSLAHIDFATTRPFRPEIRPVQAPVGTAPIAPGDRS